VDPPPNFETAKNSKAICSGRPVCVAGSGGGGDHTPRHATREVTTTRALPVPSASPELYRAMLPPDVLLV